MDDRHELERRLGEHARTVRGLAAALLRDPAAADDVAQEAALRACAVPPRQPAAMRSWLQAVVQRLCGRWRRGEARRLHREARAARAERLPSAADEVLRTEVLQAIANAVAALPPPLREVVLLRYYDDLTPRAIAARLQLSGEAVESRLRRARAQLAAALAPRFDQRDLRAALLAFAVPPAALPVLGALAMAAKSKVLPAAAAVLLLLGGSVYWLWPAVEPAPLPVAGGSAVPGPVAAANESSRSERTPVGEPAPPAAADVATSSGAWTVRMVGRVVDERRRPVASAEVTAQSNEGSIATGFSADDGRFQLELRSECAWECQYELMARSGDRSGIAAFTAPRGDEEAATDIGVIALEPSSALRVEVRRGTVPVAGASVTAVRAWFSPPGVRASGTTEPDGNVTLRGLGPRRYFVMAVAPDGGWGIASGDVALRRTNHARIDLASGTPVDVQVLAAKTREPIAGAQVEALYVLLGEGGVESRLPLAGLVALPRTDAEGRARIQGFTRNSRVHFAASHPQWQPQAAVSATAVDWTAPLPRIELLLDEVASVTWTLTSGEVPVPPEGSAFRILDVQTPLRQGQLTFTTRPLASPTTVAAVGPGCVALLPVPSAGPVALRRSRRLTVHVHDAAGSPLAGWTLRCTAPAQALLIRTASDGRATAVGFAGGKVDVSLDGQGQPQALGSVDLEAGDGFLDVVRAPSRAVRAQVFVGGQAALPGHLNLQCTNAWLTDVREDVERGQLTFQLWPHDPARDHQVRLYGSWRQSTGVAAIAPGTGPASIELRLDPLGSAVADVRLPADEQCQIFVERLWPNGQTSIWTHVPAGRGRDLPPFTNLPSGRYRLRDQLSEVSGPVVEVAGDDEGRLPLDLSAVVRVEGRVVAEGEMKGTSVRVRDAAGTELRNVPVQANGTFWVRVAVDRPGLVLVAVRGTAVSAPMPVTGAMSDLQLVLAR